MIPVVSGWLQTVLDFVFPAECEYCHQFLGDERIVIFCQSCWREITFITDPLCPGCGRPYPSGTPLRRTPHFICGECRKATPSFDRAFAATYYEDVMKEAILQFKFKQKTGLGKHLAQLLLAHFPEDIEMTNYHAILPVPLHKIRQRQRGYNQSAILARHLSHHFQLPLLENNLIRIRHTDSQWRQKGRKERQENVKNAFRVLKPTSLQDKQVILIDDVLTTGATVNECSKMLKEAGVRSIFALTLSRVRR